MMWWLKWKLREARERFWAWVANRLPARLVYHAGIRLMVFATSGPYSNTVVPELGGMDAIERWEKGKLRKPPEEVHDFDPCTEAGWE